METNWHASVQTYMHAHICRVADLFVTLVILMRGGRLKRCVVLGVTVHV